MRVCGRADKPFFTRLGLSERDFEAMVWLSSWALLPDVGPGPADAGAQPQEAGPAQEGASQGKAPEWTVANLSVAEKRSVGRQCKDLIDAGRVAWLQDMGMACEVVEYSRFLSVPGEQASAGFLACYNSTVPTFMREPHTPRHRVTKGTMMLSYTTQSLLVDTDNQR